MGIDGTIPFVINTAGYTLFMNGVMAAILGAQSHGWKVKAGCIVSILL